VSGSIGSPMGNLVVAQGGGPTPVINCSLFGIIDQAISSGKIAKVLGARYGITGVLRDDFVDLSTLSGQRKEGLKHAPGAALGSCRHKLQDQEYPRIIETFKQRDVRYLLYIGGNDSMDTADRIDQLAKREQYELGVIGVPKTVDNDLMGTDRCPGYGSAARYVAQSVRDLGVDIRSLPTPISIFEAMGRNAGWIAAASALAKTDEDSAPHRIYLPERPFLIEQFLADVEAVYRRLGWAVVVVSEGLQGVNGPSGDPELRDDFGHALPGDLAGRLAQLVSQKIAGGGVRCRSERPGVCGRASMVHVSPVDQRDAEQVGRVAVDLVVNGKTGVMVTLQPVDQGGTGTIQLAEVANNERTMPDEMIDSSGSNVTGQFLEYARPLIGPPLADYVSVNDLST